MWIYCCRWPNPPRQLITGDRLTEKSPFLNQVILSQAQAGSKIVFAVIGKRSQEIAQLAAFAQHHKLQDSLVIVASSAQDATSVISLTPFTAMTVAEYLRDQGHDVVVIFDDLTIHAKYIREISLLANQFPGRDSYPGNIFYTHARLLERAGAFSIGDTVSTITALPVAESQNSELTDFIVSNLISITDGHLLFDAVLKQMGQHPPINTSLSVTRVGKQTQTTLARQVNRQLGIFLNQYHKLQTLTHFGNELSSDAQQVLVRGKILTAFLAQESLELVPQSVQLLGAALILQGWWDQLDSHIIKKYRQLLTKASRTEGHKQLVTTLTASPDYQTLLAEMTKNKKAIEKIWQL
jgi:F-type H+-transporting ATPase subunit alpha